MPTKLNWINSKLIIMMKRTDWSISSLHTWQRKKIIFVTRVGSCTSPSDIPLSELVSFESINFPIKNKSKNK